MGISRITAYIIATRSDIVISAGGPTENGKYVGWITLGEEDRYRPLLNTEPIYDTPEAAKEAMTKVVAEVKTAVEQETGGEHPIDHVLGETHGAVVKQIVQAAQDMKKEGK